MQEYEITIKETLQRTVKVEATSLAHAIAKVEFEYRNESIVLDYSDLKDLEIYKSRKGE